MGIFYIFVLFGIFLLRVKSDIMETMTILSYKNDRIELDCSSYDQNISITNLSIFDSEIVHNSSELLNLNIILFKKNNILIQIQNKSFNLLIRNASDEGLYECGYYYLNRYGEFVYFSNAKWLIKVLNNGKINDCQE